MTQYAFTANVTCEELGLLVRIISPYANEDLYRQDGVSHRIVQQLRLIFETYNEPESKIKLVFGENAFDSIRSLIQGLLEQKDKSEDTQSEAKRLDKIFEEAWQRTRPTMFPHSAHLYSRRWEDSDKRFAEAATHFII